MIKIPVPNSALAENYGRRARKIVKGALALATMLLLPLSAWGMNGSAKLMIDAGGSLVPLPPIPYLSSMRWMDW
jgi:hypothetical protein